MIEREETQAMLERTEALTKKILRVLREEDARCVASSGQHLALGEGLLALSGAMSSALLVSYGVEEEDIA